MRNPDGRRTTGGRGALLAAASTREGIAPQPCACQWPAMRGGGVLSAQHEAPHAQRQRERRQGDAKHGLEVGGPPSREESVPRRGGVRKREAQVSSHG